jgi:hypothetical protein
VVFFWPQVVGGRALYWGDIGLYFTPMLSFLHENLTAGRIPLWNPRILCGAPYVGNPQTWPLYPFTFLLRFLDAPAFTNVTIAFHVWFGAVGTYLFLRHASDRKALPALLGAIVFAFGGQLVSKEQFPNMIQAAAYLPWVLWMTHRLAVNRRGCDALWLGLVLGLQLLAAHAQIVLLTLYLAAAYGIVVLFRRRPTSWQEWRSLLGLTILASVAAVGLAAGQLLPTTELYRDAWRQRLSFHIVDRFYLPLNQLGNVVLPTLHGHPLYGDFTARGNFWETCCFTGWVAFALAVWGASRSWRRSPSDLFWTNAALVGLLMALGGQTWRGNRATNGLYWVAYHILPGFRSFHDPARCLLWVGFSLAVLASGGMQALTNLRQGRLLSPVLIFIAFAELLHFGRALYPLADPAMLHPTTPLIASIQAEPEFQAHQARILSPDTARVWQRFTGHHSYRRAVTDYASLWADTLTPNLMVPYGLPNAYGYEPMTRLDTQTVCGTVAAAFQPTATREQRMHAASWAGFLGVRDVMTLRTHPPTSAIPGLAPLRSEPTLAPLGTARDPARLYFSRNERWQPRARLMTDFRPAATDKQALAKMIHALTQPDTLDLGRTVVLTSPAPFISTPSLSLPAQIVQDDPDRVVVEAETSAPEILVLADTRHPGWQATVNGHLTPIHSADACLRAVILPAPGRYNVVFSDRPTSFLFGLYLSLLTVAGLSGAAAYSVTRSRKKT